ncbi:TonB-dependent receptor [Marinilabilia rubra]|nr:TonB-dependent receptor [Marinilabilia rubra]
MRITLFLMLIGVSQLFAESSYAQIKKLSIDLENVKAEKVLDEIENQSQFYFLYNEKLVDVDFDASVKFTEENIFKVLDQLFDGRDISYQVVDNQIILSKANASMVMLQQDQKTVTGTVTDQDGEPIPGVNVFIKGTTRGTTTDVKGNYSLEKVSSENTLVFSFIGMETKEVVANDQMVIDVALESTSIGLEEVVAIGYGVSKRSVVTGSISTVKSDDLPKTANTSVTHMLSGKASGVQVKQTSAQPGGGIDIVIRGAGSVNAGNQPLYVIDGFPINNSSVEPGSGDRYNMGSRNPLNSINPNDIESIEILKDAASTAIYGARAANGVILITTKRGKEGHTVVDFSLSHSVQEIDRYFDMLDAKGFMEQANILGEEYYLISNNQYPYGSNDQDLSGFTQRFTSDQIANAGKGTDWWDEVTRLGSVDDVNLSISGGSKKTNFMISANYFDQKGVVYNSDFTRFSSRINLDHKITDFLKVGISATGSYVDNGNTQLGDGQWENSGVLVSALQMSPLISVYNAYGEYSINPKDAVMPNPVSYREIDDNTIQKRLLANSYVQVEPLKGLIIKANVGIDDKSGTRSNYLPTTFLYGAQYGGKATKSISNSTDLLFNSTVSYSRVFNEQHNVNVLLGYEYQEFKYNGFGSEATKFFTDIFESNNLGAGEGRPDVYSYKNAGKLASYFSRLSYNYKEKYIASFTLRRDGTSNFGSGNKWGLFPSTALAWRISEEEFIKSVDVLSNLKLRASYGQTGNSGIGDKAFEYYGTRGEYMFGDIVVTPVTKTQLGNSDLKWETTKEFNVGLDFGFYKNRISGTLEYYNKVVDDLLSYRTLPTYSDISSVADNIGSTQLKGFEFELNTVNIAKELKWTTNFNISTYTDNWKERNPDLILDPWQGENDPIRSMYGYKTNGIVQLGEDIPHMENELPGNLIYQDLNGFDENNELTGIPDGKIDAADITYLGTWDPGISFGIGNTFEYMGLDLNFFFYGMADRILTNPNTFKYKLDAWRLPNGDNNMMKEVDRIFRADSPSTTTPGMAAHPYQGSSDYYIEDGSFIRLKNVTLGYTIPRRIFKNKLDMRVYVDGQNLLLITGYSGVDPETDGLGSYPNAKTFSFGVNLKF